MNDLNNSRLLAYPIQDVKQKDLKEYEGLKFQYYPHSNKVYLSGSIHKYKNNGEHNYDDLHHSKFNETLIELEEEFGIKPKNIKLNQIESSGHGNVHHLQFH